MILGIFDLTTFTVVHTFISIVAIFAGLVVVGGILNSSLSPGWTALFILTAVATSVTGFFFPFTGFLPSHGVGIIALIVLAVAILARYVYRLAGAWRWIYAVTAVISIYLLVFVAIAQTFLKVPSLAAAAPTQSEPPFLFTQLIALVAFAALAVAAAVTFRPRGR